MHYFSRPTKRGHVSSATVRCNKNEKNKKPLQLFSHFWDYNLLLTFK